MIIGIVGQKFNGKSEIAKRLNITNNFVRLSFAKKVKEAAQIIYNFSNEQVNGVLKEVIDTRYNLTPRIIMQKIGTEVARQIHSRTWLMCLENEIKKYGHEVNFVIDDVRFLNEANWIKEHGGIIIRVIRDIQSTDTHASEIEMHDIVQDFTILNNGTFPQLYYQVDMILLEMSNVR